MHIVLTGKFAPLVCTGLIFVQKLARVRNKNKSAEIQQQD